MIYIIGLPPRSSVKKCAPANLSRNNNASVTVKIGKANKIMIQVENTDHVNIGIFIHFMPGARILMMVTRKLIPVAREPIPEICIPHI
ncbi:hypothetical protein D3C76_1090070 [compost metagenome]